MKTQKYTLKNKPTKVKVSEWFPPYQKVKGKRQTTLPSIVKKPKHGVYIIKRSGGKRPLYIGYSASNLYKTLYRHFQYWVEPKHQHATYKGKHGYRVRVLIPPASLVKDLEHLLVQHFNPRDNHLRYQGHQLGFFPQEAQAFTPVVDDIAYSDWSRDIDRSEEDEILLPF